MHADKALECVAILLLWKQKQTVFMTVSQQRPRATNETQIGEMLIKSTQVVGPTEHLLGVAYLHVGVAYLPVT